MVRENQHIGRFIGSAIDFLIRLIKVVTQGLITKPVNDQLVWVYGQVNTLLSMFEVQGKEKVNVFSVVVIKPVIVNRGL